MKKIEFLSEKQEKQLKKYLQPSLNKDVLTIDQLDGFLFGLCISSPFISSDEIVASIFGSSSPVFDSFEDVSSFNECLVQAQNTYTYALNNNKLVFPFTIAENNLTDEMIHAIQDWCYGFIRGIILDYNDWMPPDKQILETLQVEEELMYTCFFVIYMTAYILYPDKLPLSKEFLKMVDVDKFKEELTKNILALPDAVEILIQYGKQVRDNYLKNGKLQKKIDQNIKIGRNDPCICGSGKKYKKCCGR
ncbi:MAG: UPF0149 family protein [Spirochaetes bacterium]|nr:UPF0149 family protein [Spirochaetota bacterium]